MTEQRDPHRYSRAIAVRIKSMRKRRGWTADRLAEEMTKIGISWNHGIVTKLETGRRQSVTLDEAMAITEVFRLDLDELLSSACDVCAGAPPVGFTCNECGRKGTP